LVSLLRVPDGRAGSGHCWVGLMALVNKCKQCGNIIISVPKMPAHCFALLRASGGVFGQEKYIFGFRVINCMYWAIVHVSGRVWWGGFQRMGLDDDSQLGRCFHFGMDAPLGARARCWARFSRRYIYILVDITYSQPFHPFPCIWGGRNGWMALDVFWMSFPK